MKAVMLSIQPRHCENICTEIGNENGKPVYKKTIEMRKKAPKCDTPFKCYIYCTKGKVDKRGKHLHVIEPRKRKDYGSVEEWSNATQDTLIVNGGYMAYKSYLADGKVIGEFVCDKVENIMVDIDENDHVDYLVSDEFLSNTCLSFNEICRYLRNGDGYGLHISQLKIYDTPKELGEFNGFKKCAVCKVSGYEVSACIHDENCMIPVPLTRPPQSWCYVEELTI